MEQGMSTTPSSMHSEAALNRRLVLFASQLETYIAHFPSCHKYALTQTIRQTSNCLTHHIDSGIKPFFPKCASQFLVADPQLCSPILGGQSNAIDLNQDGAPLVSELLRAQGPAHVLRAVRPIVVNPLKRVSAAGRISDIVGKSGKRLRPRIAQNNAPSPVVFEERATGVFAPLLHRHPTVVHGVSSQSSINKDAFGPGAGRLRPKAAARPRAAMSQTSRRDGFLVAAIADAGPKNPAIGRSFTQTCNQKTAKTLPSQINRFFVHRVQNS
jgi:hypothetical protein